MEITIEDLDKRIKELKIAQEQFQQKVYVCAGAIVELQRLQATVENDVED